MSDTEGAKGVDAREINRALAEAMGWGLYEKEIEGKAHVFWATDHEAKTAGAKPSHSQEDWWYKPLGFTPLWFQELWDWLLAQGLQIDVFALQGKQSVELFKDGDILTCSGHCKTLSEALARAAYQWIEGRDSRKEEAPDE